MKSRVKGHKVTWRDLANWVREVSPWWSSAIDRLEVRDPYACIAGAMLEPPGHSSMLNNPCLSALEPKMLVPVEADYAVYHSIMLEHAFQFHDYLVYQSLKVNVVFYKRRAQLAAALKISLCASRVG